MPETGSSKKRTRIGPSYSQASAFLTYSRACGPCKRVFTIGAADAAASPGSMRKGRMNVIVFLTVHVAVSVMILNMFVRDTRIATFI